MNKPVERPGSQVKDIHHYIGGREVPGSSGRYGDVYNPALGEASARVAFASTEEAGKAVAAARAAFPTWAATPPLRRARVMFKFKELVERDHDKLACLISSEHGKVVSDARGEVTRGLEVVEFACGIPHLLKGDYSEQVGTGVDSYSGFDNSPQETPYSAAMSNDQAFSAFDLAGLNHLHAQFAAGDPEGLIPTLDEFSAYQMQLGTATEGLNAGLKPISEDQLMMNMRAGSFAAAAPAHVHGLSPGAQGSLMLYAPDSGMSGNNISSDFPFGLPLAQQPVNDFTLFGESASQEQSPGQMYGQSEHMSMD